MIEKYGYKREMVCDCCEVGFGKTYDADDWEIMISDAKAAGWRMRKEGKEWKHFCPSC